VLVIGEHFKIIPKEGFSCSAEGAGISAPPRSGGLRGWGRQGSAVEKRAAGGQNLETPSSRSSAVRDFLLCFVFEQRCPGSTGPLSDAAMPCSETLHLLAMRSTECRLAHGSEEVFRFYISRWRISSDLDSQKKYESSEMLLIKAQRHISASISCFWPCCRF